MDIVNKIHIPNIRSYINVVLTLSLISTLGNFGLVAAATGGGPGYATMDSRIIYVQSCIWRWELWLFFSNGSHHFYNSDRYYFNLEPYQRRRPE
jgi:hypothetical protein